MIFTLKYSQNEKCFRRNLLRKIKTHIFTFDFFFQNRAVCEIMWKNVIELDRTQTPTQYGSDKMRIACWITKDTAIHPEYVILIVFFPLQRRLHKSA